MKYYASLLIVPLFLANIAIAHPAHNEKEGANNPAQAQGLPELPSAPAPTLSPEIPIDLSDLKMPSQDEIAAITEQLPDMAAILGDMKALIEDESFTGGMERSMDTLSGRMKQHTNSGGEPDMNAMFADMLSLLSDEEFVGGMVQTIGPIQEMMIEHMPEQANALTKGQASTPAPVQPE